MATSPQKTTLLRALLATTALSGAAGLFIEPAKAADECGAPVNGVVTCAPAAYTDISYTGVTPNIRINVEAGATANSLRLTGPGTLTVDADVDTRFEATGDDSRGIEALGQGQVAVMADKVSATGARAIALNARGERDVVAIADDVEASGHEAVGVFADSSNGSVSVKARSVNVKGGTLGAGISADGRTGIFVQFGTVEVEGDERDGIYANSDDGDVSVILYPEAGPDAGDISASGQDANGLTATAYNGAITAVVRDVSLTGGRESAAVQLVAQGDVDLTFRSLRLTGESSDAIYASSRSGTVNLVGDSITADGQNTDAVVVFSNKLIGGIGSISTTGAYSEGFTYNPHAGLADVDFTIGSVETAGDYANGVILGGNGGDYRMGVGSITTAGEEAHGVLLSSVGADYTLDFGSITTTGENAFGINTEDLAGLIDIKADSISTQGDYATGALLKGEEVRLNIGMLSTQGEDAVGLLVEAQTADVTLGSVVVAGDYSHGVYLLGFDADFRLKAESISTSGENSNGLVLGGDASRFDIEVGEVSATGFGSAAIQANYAESVKLTAETLVTTGESASTLYLYADDITLDVGTVRATGDNALGVFLSATGSSDPTGVNIRGRVDHVETTGQDSLAFGVQGTGRFDLEVGSIHTTGAESKGFWAGKDDGGILSIGSILTEGYASTGATLETSAGGFDATFDQIETRGALSTGIDLIAEADTTLTMGSVRTLGENAMAVYSEVRGGALSLKAEDIRTTGTDSTGIWAAAEEGMTLTLGYIDVIGTATDAVHAISLDELTLTATRRLGSASGLAADLRGETIDVTLASTAVVAGGSGGLLLSSSNGATVTNGGSISSANGYAIEAEAGAVTLNNSGLVSGRVRFSSADDVVNNAGRFTAEGDSVFGAGDDVFNNAGVINLAAGVTGVEFLGLERLNNAGTIDLTNGVAGDVFEVSGLINGQAGGRIGLDLDLRGATPTADRIVAGGFEGLSEIVLTLQGRASLGDTGVVVAQSGMAQTGQEMTVRVAGGGFVGFDVAFADGEYRISGELAPPAFEPTKVATGAQHQWTSGADMVSARFDQMRDEGGRPQGRGDQVWAQVYGGSNDIEARRAFDLMGESIDADLSHEVKSQGVQAGVDRAVPVEDGSLVFGMLAGAGKTELRFQNGDVTDYDGVGVGAYGHWFSGPLSIGVLAKLDTFKLDYDWAEANLKTRSNGFTVGARVDAAWRIQAGQGWYVEPQASLSWADTALGRLKARDGAEVVFGDTRSVVGRIGVRAGAQMAVGDGLSFKPFAALHALNEFDGDNASTLLLGDEAVGVTDRAHGAWGRAVLGASLDAPSGLGGFIQAEGDFGEVEGFTARAGIKFSW